MKRIFLLIISLLILSSCAMDPETLDESDYLPSLYEKYEEAKAIDVFKGDCFEAKLITMDRYIKDDGVLYYNYRIALKPLDNLNTKKITLSVKLNQKQREYYSGTPNQLAFSKYTYPVELNNDEDVPCLEYRFTIASVGFQTITQEKWERLMEDITVSMTWGTHEEKIHFHPEPIATTYSANHEALELGFGQIQ